jgi:hypothetical protein
MQERTQAELIVKTVALHLAICMSAGHLMSLQQQSWKRSKSTIWQLSWLLAVSTHPLALVIDRSIRIGRLLLAKGTSRISLSYCVDSVLGVHAKTIGQDEGSSVPLIDVAFEDLQCLSAKKGLPWIGRLFVLLCLSVQAVGTLVLSGRRLHAGQMGDADIRIAWTAFGGLTINLMSAVIVLKGHRWTYVPAPNDTHPATQQAFSATSKQGVRMGIIARLITTGTILSSWYFRLHIRHTLGLALRRMPDEQNWSPYKRPDPGRSSLPFLVWLAWPVLIFHAQSTNGTVVLLVSLFHALSFPLEELATNKFTKWKDPLADTLYVF